MKYPQLVSTRAVNAISDWLVSRLEQIGVEAPLIYSRLLLSLLHSSVQINDPIEFSNLETYLASRKGSKRISPLDTETFKKFTAVQCLMDAVSSDEEISKVEILVDELCKKLHDIENQINEDNLNKSPPNIRSIVLDTEDPRKRYYRAFPALSKEMEDTVWMSKKNAKSLTWPTANSATALTPINKANGMNVFSNTAGVKRKHKRRRNQALSKGKAANIRKNSFGGNCSPTWDTDFEGSWEMGRDLIKEFIVMQNNRNRSTSESDACNIQNIENLQKRMKPTEKDDETEEYFSLPQTILDFKTDSEVNTSLDEDQSSKSDVILNDMQSYAKSTIINDEGYSTPEGLASFSETERNSNMARRLYERDVSNDTNEQNDFALLEAKFNSSVEALWKDNNENVPKSNHHRNLESFWTNYYNHHYDTKKFGKQNYTDSSDYFSMPNSFSKLNDPPIDEENARRIIGEKKFAPAGIALSASIWSDIPQKNNYDEDDCFYANVFTSSYKNKKDENYSDVKDHLNPYGNSKWSECSFETPFIPYSSTVPLNETAMRNDKRENTMKSSYLYNYKQHFIPESTINSNNNSNQSIKNSTTTQTATAPMSLPNSFYDSLNSFENVEKVRANQGFKQTTITLKNHSKTSGFVEVSKLKYESKVIGPPSSSTSVQQQSSTASAQKVGVVEEQAPRPVANLSPLNDEDNLLTSERTHFRPIKQNYADGHEFSIPYNYENVQYERSKSGFLYFESDKYLEYKEGGSNDDDSSSNAARKKDKGNDSRDDVDGLDKFSIKFRVKRTDKFCQTDDCASDGYVLPVRKINANVDFDEMSDSNDCLMLENEDKLPKEENSINIEQWSMEEMRKRCLDNNNSHTLWGMCSACNKENKSLPANRLLKDELNMEGDEIMSNLKYMRDLYIGSDWEDDDDDDDTYNDGDADMVRQCEIIEILEGSDDDDEQDHIFYNITKLIADLLKPENAKSLANALNSKQGKTIFGSMCAEAADEFDDGANKINSGEITDYSFQDGKAVVWKNLNNNNNNNVFDNNISKNNNNNNNNNNEKYIGGLWTDDENAIWQGELKPINQSLWSKLTSGSSFLDKINWEYSNLAEIWNNTTADKPNIQSTAVKAAPMTSDNINNHIAKAEIECNEIRNIKNLLSRNISPQKYSNENDKTKSNVNFRNKVVNRFDRKRRHSASQNVNTLGSNDFPDNIIIGNKVEIMANQEMDYGKFTSINDSPATIITCKYWTTFDASSAAADHPWATNASPFVANKASLYDGSNGTFTINPSSILKHVTVVSRPLTR